MGEVRGFTKENLKKLVKFDTKDIFWIIFFAFLFISAWAYNRDLNLCKAQLETECIDKCRWDEQVKEYISKVKEDYPYVQVSCYYETKSCEIAGVREDIGGIHSDWKKFQEEFNLTLKNATK